jgi:hypothetical protein
MSKLYHVAKWSGQTILMITSLPDHLRKFVPDISHLIEKEDEDMTMLKAKASEVINA